MFLAILCIFTHHSIQSLRGRNKGGMSCSICTESYQNSKEICSTICGHIFHFSCLRQWQNRSDTCPLCNKSNPQPHRIFLEFKEDVPRAAKVKSDDGDNELVIKGLRPNQISYPLKKTIMMLIAAMNLSIKESDIKYVLRTGNNLCVSFKVATHRDMFLKNKKYLKDDLQTSAIKIHEALDEDTEDLFKYCHKLKQKGYKIVFVNNNKVYVKKQNKEKPINILSKEQVDNLCKCMEKTQTNGTANRHHHNSTATRSFSHSPAAHTSSFSHSVSPTYNYEDYVNDYDDDDNYYDEPYRPSYSTSQPTNNSSCSIS